METPNSPPISLSPRSALPEKRPSRTRRFPQLWREFEATSYTPVVTVHQVNEEAFEQRTDPPVSQQPAVLATPNLSGPSPHRSPLTRFHVCRVSPRDSSVETNQVRTETEPQTPINHPFKNDSVFELLKTLQLGPSSKTAPGLNAVAQLICSGKVKPEEMSGFNATTELRRLDQFAAESPIAGGPWKTGSVKIKMPCTRANNPKFFTEADAPEFEVPGVRYRSLVDLITSKVQDPSGSGSFVHTPFTEWWCPPGSMTPVRIYGEAHSSNVAAKLFEQIKGIPPPVDGPQVDNVVVLLMLGSDETHLANFGTASLWPIYMFFGNMSKYDTCKPSEFAACHLAYLPKVCWDLFGKPVFELTAQLSSCLTTFPTHTSRNLESLPHQRLSHTAAGSCIMLSSSSSSRVNLQKRTKKVSSSSFPTVSLAVYSLAYIVTWPITQRSLSRTSQMRKITYRESGCSLQQSRTWVVVPVHVAESSLPTFNTWVRHRIHKHAWK